MVLVPNLPNPGVAVDLGWLSGTVPADQLQEMQEASRDRPAAQESFGIQARNLARLNQAGVTIAFGTDGSTPWSPHLEMEDMVRSGMTPAEVIVAATSTSAELMQMSDVGTVAAGKSADFVRPRCELPSRTSPTRGGSPTPISAASRSTGTRSARASAGGRPGRPPALHRRGSGVVDAGGRRWRVACSYPYAISIIVPSSKGRPSI